MLHSAIRYSLLIGLFALTPACGPSGDDDSGGTGGGGGMGAGKCDGATLTASPDKNYEFSSTLTIELTTVKAASELTLNWGGVTTDFLKRPVDLNKVDMVEVSLWEMGLDAFEEKLNNDTLDNPIVIADIRPPDGATSGSIFGLNVPSGPLTEQTILNYLSDVSFPPANHMYAVMVANGFDYGKGTYMLAGFKVDPQSTNTTVNITSDSTKVDFTAGIASRPPTYIPAGTSAVTLDWTKMKKTAAGLEFIPSSITKIRIGHYTQTPTELEGDAFLQLDEIAAEMYSAEVKTGTTFSFDKTKTADGAPFTGIDDTGTWIVALNCGGCQNPAPWYLSVLKPCSSP